MRLATLVSLVALAAASAPAAAQAPAPDAGAAAAADPEALIAALAGPQRQWRRPLGATAESLLFGGEAASRLLPVFVAPGEASLPTRLELSTLSAISASPTASRLSVSLNGTPLGERAVRAFDEPEILRFDIAAGVLQPGFNELRLDVAHAHRVDCSIDATYELWTRVLPEASGFVFDGVPRPILDLSSLAAVPVGPDGRTEIRLRTGGDRSPESLERLARAIQALVIAGRYAEPVVTVDGGAAEGHGIDLVVATRDRLRSLGLSVPPMSGPGAALVDDPRAGRRALVFTSTAPEELDVALAQFERAARERAPIGSEAGLAALEATGRRLLGGETLTLPEIGLDPRPFAGRFFNADAEIVLPGDFYAADYGRMTLSIDAAYAAGLAPGSELVVRVNGAVVASVALADPRGDVLRDREVNLPLASFKAGHNRIAFEARTPARADETCAPEAIGRGHDRFVLSPTTTLRVPRLARIGSLPDVSGLAAGSLALVSGSGGLDVAIPGGDPDAVAATMTLLAQSAAATGRTTPIRIGFGTTGSGGGHALVVGAFDRIGDDVLRAADLPAERIRAAWTAAAGPPISAVEPPAPVRPIRVASAGTAVLIDLDASLDAPEPAMITPGAADGAAAPLALPGGLTGLGWLDGAVAAGIERVLAIAALDVPALGFARAPAEHLAVDAETTLVVGQGAVREGGYADVLRQPASDLAGRDLFGARGTGLLPRARSITVITAPTGPLLREGMADFLTSGVSQQLVGQSVAYRSAESRVASRIAPADVLVETQALSVGNARLVIAGWLSRNPGFYLIALGGLGLLLSVVGYAAIRLSGVRN